MLAMAAMAMTLEPTFVLIARLLVVDGGGGGDAGGGGSAGSGGNGGAAKEVVIPLEPGDYSVTVAPTVAWGPGTSANPTPSSFQRTSAPTYVLAGVGTPRNTAPGPAQGAAPSVVASDITGASIVYGYGGAAGDPLGTGGGHAGFYPGWGGAGGNGDDEGGATNDGGAGAAGAVILRYTGPQRFTGGTVTTVGDDTVHVFPVGTTTFTVPF